MVCLKLFFKEDFFIHQSYISIFYGLQAKQVLGNILFENTFPILPKMSWASKSI